jgi:hypothetical protein
MPIYVELKYINMEQGRKHVLPHVFQENCFMNVLAVLIKHIWNQGKCQFKEH